MLFKDDITIQLRCSKQSALGVLTRYSSKKGYYPSFIKIKPDEVKGDNLQIRSRNIGMRYYFIINIRFQEIDNGCRLIISAKEESIVEGFFIVGLTFALFLSVASIGDSIAASTFGIDIIFPIMFSAIWTLIFILFHKIALNETKKRFKRVFEKYLVRDEL